MRVVITFLALCMALSAKGQFAIVADKDGFVNVRRENNIADNIVDTLKNGHLIYCFEEVNNWTNIDFDRGNGFIYKDRYKLISTFDEIPIEEQKGTSITLHKDNLKIAIATSKFDKTKHKLKFVKDENKWIELIDNKKYWGTDGEIPEFEYRSIEINIRQKRLMLPKSATEDLFQPNLKNTKANYDNQTDTLYIHSINSDGAGGYLVIWKITNGEYRERYVAYGF
ncbi:MAG TPA: hypothetical protein VK666_08245 [Chryseolinea sp.]|nr:hypothetical protein [Chryseolinea sp.]